MRRRDEPLATRRLRAGRPRGLRRRPPPSRPAPPFGAARPASRARPASVSPFVGWEFTALPRGQKGPEGGEQGGSVVGVVGRGREDAREVAVRVPLPGGGPPPQWVGRGLGTRSLFRAEGVLCPVGCFCSAAYPPLLTRCRERHRPQDVTTQSISRRCQVSPRGQDGTEREPPSRAKNEKIDKSVSFH